MNSNVAFTKEEIENFRNTFNKLIKLVKSVWENIKELIDKGLLYNRDEKPTYFYKVKVLKSQVLERKPKYCRARSSC